VRFQAKNIFFRSEKTLWPTSSLAKISAKIIAVFDSKQSQIKQKFDHNIGF
jgi:hypothetical protein